MAQTSAFTYQGRLHASGAPASGTYDLQFTIYNSPNNGSALGVVTNAAASVSNGLFTAQLDFGISVFDGASRWLEIGVRTNGDTGVYTLLNPRQPITSAPYAIQSANAAAATTAQVADVATVATTANSVTAENVSGTLSVSQLPASVLVNGATGVTLSGAFNGNGSGLSSVNADSLDGLDSTAFGYLNSNNIWAGTNLFNANAGFGSLSPQAKLEIQAGADNNGGGDLKAMALAYRDGGYRHWIRTRHNVGANPGNAIDFFLNTGDGASESSAPGVGNTHTLTLDNGRVGVGVLSPSEALDVVGNIRTTGSFVGNAAGLTNLSAAQIPSLDASKITTGTIALARLPGSLVTNNATGVTFSGVFSGDGSGLTNLSSPAWQVASETTRIAEANQSYLVTSSSQATVILPQTAEVGDTISVSGSGPGGWQIMDSTWIEHPQVAGNYWRSIASSADGTKLVAVGLPDSSVSVSTNSGTSWTRYNLNRGTLYLESVACSADGNKMVAAGTASQILTSSDSGVTWTARENNRGWSAVASSADGTKLVAAVKGGQIYTSTDSGVTWTPRDTARLWVSVASSSDGTKLVACVESGKIYTSTDSGVSWTPRESDRYWMEVASSADGSKLVAVGWGTYIYVSTDSGVTWTPRENGRTWTSVASSSDGTKLVAVGNNAQIYTSTDFGVTWTPSDAVRQWEATASSADGNKLIASSRDSFRYYTSGRVVMSGEQGSVGTIQYIGNGQWQPLQESQLSSNAALLNGDNVFTGNNTISGTFSGSGANLSSLNAANISSGTLADARLSSNVALLNASQTFTGVPTLASGGKISGTQVLEFGANVAGKEMNAGKIGYGTFSGDSLDLVGAGDSAQRRIKFFAEGGAQFLGGVSMTGNLNAGNGGFAGNLNANKVIAGEGTFSNNVAIVGSLNAQSGSFSGSVTTTNNLTVGGVIAGNGAGITNLNSSGLTGPITVANSRVGIGITDPQTALDVFAPDTLQLRLRSTGGTDTWRIYTEGATGNLLFLPSAGVFGVISKTTGNYTSGSDSRLKKDITPLDEVLDRVLQLRPVSYRFNPTPDTAPKTYGLIAQEVELLFPEVVGQAGGYKTLAYSELVPVTIKAIQEVKQKTDDRMQKLEAANAELTQRNHSLEKRLQALERMIHRQSGNQ